MPADMQALDRNGKPVSAGQQADSFGFPSVFSELDNSMVGKAHEDLTGVKAKRVMKNHLFRFIPYQKTRP